jgi:hypothetical protein
MEGLIDTRDEYIEHIQDILSVAISKRIYAIYTEIMDEKKGLKGFQNELYSIRKWNNNIVSDEYKKIVKYTKCKYLANLIKIIIITTIKIKIYEYREQFDNIKIKIPNAEDFVHKCYTNAASFSWKNAYLYNRNNIKDAEYQNNLNIIEENIRAIVKKTFRDFIPFDEIFKQIEDNLSDNIHQYKDTDAKSVDVEISKKKKKTPTKGSDAEEAEEREEDEADEDDEAEESEEDAESEEDEEDAEDDDEEDEEDDDEAEADEEEDEAESEAVAVVEEAVAEAEAEAEDKKVDIQRVEAVEAVEAVEEAICEDNKINNIVDDKVCERENIEEISFANREKDKEDETNSPNTIHKEWDNIKDEYSSLSHSSLSETKTAYKIPENEGIHKKKYEYEKYAKYDNYDDDTISISSRVSNITDVSQIKKINITETKNKKTTFF